VLQRSGFGVTAFARDHDHLLLPISLNETAVLA
jgi:hypothetical protein